MLAYIIAATILLSIVAFFAIIIGTAVGAGADNGFSQGVWPTVFLLPLIGLPIGFLLIVGLLVLSGVRRSRAAKGAGQ